MVNLSGSGTGRGFRDQAPIPRLRIETNRGYLQSARGFCDSGPAAFHYEEIADVFAALEFRLQQFDRAADYVALQLHKTSIKEDAAVHSHEEAKRSFAPNIRGLNCRAVLQNG